MAVKRIDELPVSDGLTDDGLLVVYQSNETQSIKGEHIRKYAEDKADEYLKAGVSAGVREEASVVADKAMSRGDIDPFRFIAFADAHQKNDHAEITAGNKELGQGMNEVLKMIGVDFVANLGDIVWGSSSASSETVREEAKALNRMISDAIKGQTVIATEGNHETGKLSYAEVYALIYSFNKDFVWGRPGSVVNGYGYKDFPNKKIRVISLNTNEMRTQENVSGMSNEQLKWFAQVALNMEGKTDWSVITLGHHPLSYNTVSLMRYAATIMEAFLAGTALSLTTNDGVEIAFNYTGKNCQYVAHFHAHAHAFSVVKMQKYVSSGVYEELDAWEICIPNACFTRNNQYLNNGTYTERYSTETTYNKENVDGKRTSFNVITVGLDTKTIYADNFGAGIDRVIDYDFGTMNKYVNQLPISQDMNSTDPFNGTGYMTGYYLTSASPYYTAGQANEWVTGYIHYTVDKPIYLKGVSFTTASHDRMYFFSDKATRVNPAVSGSTIGTYFTVEQMEDGVCKLTPISGSGLSADARYVRFSFTTGTPSEVIITVDQPIE